LVIGSNPIDRTTLYSEDGEMVNTEDLKSSGEVLAGSSPAPRTIFVFGSNLAGRHGKGSALEARIKHGAIYGRGLGLHGNSYAIPTKDARFSSLSLEVIGFHVANFLSFVHTHPDWQFNIVDIGCGLAGYGPEDIAPLFKGAPKNCRFLGELETLITYD
jgi:hypothetical protein